MKTWPKKIFVVNMSWGGGLWGKVIPMKLDECFSDNREAFYISSKKIDRSLTIEESR